MKEGGLAMLFQADGVRFQYPESWSMTREDGDNGWIVTVQRSETAFFILRLDDLIPEVSVLAQTVLDTLRSDYPDLEAEEVRESIAGQTAVGHDIQFFSLDLTNTCCTRVLTCEMGTLLAMWQADDLELDEVEPIFRAICASLRVDE
jgi:hypothetical protein